MTSSSLAFGDSNQMGIPEWQIYPVYLNPLLKKRCFCLVKLELNLILALTKSEQFCAAFAMFFCSWTPYVRVRRAKHKT